MKLSLIITTYNSPKFLKLVLDSVRQQIVLPDEVIIADDGSGDETKILIETEQENFPIPLLHAWQEDRGFRAAKSRNNGIKASSGDYIVFIDGDIILDHRFIQDYHFFAHKNQFIQGRRCHLSETYTEKIILEMKIPKLNFFSKGIQSNRMQLLHWSFLRNFYTWLKKSKKGGSIISANLGIWKEDLLRVNGFNEDFIGWGREDSELGIRLLNAGVNIRFLKFAAIGIHLYHSQNRIFLPQAEQLLKNAIQEHLTWCSNGIT